jgi:hypothetical protein
MPTSWPTWPRIQAAFCCRGQCKFSAATQIVSQNLASGCNVDPSNNSAQLHALPLVQAKDITMCYGNLMAHLVKDGYRFAAKSSNFFMQQ